MQLTRKYSVGKVDIGKLHYRHQFKKCRKYLIWAGLFAIGCVMASLLNVLNNTTHRETAHMLSILYYVNLAMSILFYLIGVSQSKCCRCNRKVPVRRYNIGRILSGQMPLCPTCKLICGFDFVEETE